MIAAALAAVQDRINEAARAAGRDPDSVALVAVSKTHPAEAVEEAVLAGQLVFGENRVQEAKAKFPDLKARFPQLELHLIGPLQTNKVREAVALFDVIESIDRPKLARAVADEMARIGRKPRLLIQVNTGREDQKAGCDPDHVDSLITVCRDQYHLEIEGLMCIPPAEADPAPHFRLLAEMAARNGLSVLSMGMSGDYPAAIRAGATHVRVGSAIFGHRDYA
ncbi:YggS family pyridoxal phosphate-dependent enzyme [Paramagnetospirillum kuznetsovii]|uniref:Pyridoxal phosphate homeostasis protein n=1 Tax=Paramagnetospirillum kuznetsovii TaxID=2053833 RepID=A0A364P2S3_9PROT|nr:YggS family pyridoxal phosphate-dependent enzyme [Paramagnetospirillum kuznetsovii]RAU23611.1 YggS family pyridoxal phosphate-dependent enzyme [Paramagnetospirillum kuznetsovii]